MRARSFAMCLTLAAGVASTALAQYPNGESGPGAPGGMRRGRGMMGGRGGMGMTPLDPVVVEGPPAPAEFARITSVPDTQRYARLYNGFMSSTRPQRDSLGAARSALRDAFEERDRDAGRRQVGLVKSLGDDLSKRLNTFDNAVKDLVGKDEWKRYQDWRSQRRKEAEDRRHEVMGRRETSAPPADRVPDAQ